MKEIVIISSNKKYIIAIEKSLNRMKSKEFYLATIYNKEVSKIGIAYNKGIEKILINPLKHCFKEYKRQYYKNLDINTDKSIIEKFVKLNIVNECKYCFEKVKFNKTIYIDSVFNFLTKELEVSWTKLGNIIKDIDNKTYKDNLINFNKSTLKNSDNNINKDK